MRFTFMSFVVMCSGAQQNDVCNSFHGIECTDKSVTGYKTGVRTSDACCQACQGQAGCKAWSWNFKDGHCHLKEKCDNTKPNSDYHSGMTNIANQVNAAFNQEHNGLYLRMVHPDLSALDEDGLASHMISWVILNKYAIGENLIQLYKNGGRPAILAMPRAHKHVKCQYPCDGDTDDRHYACTVPGCPCDTGGQDDWCDHAFSGTAHKPCAFKGDQTTKMMEAFKDVQTGKSTLLQNKACGYYHVPGQSHNEAVMNSHTWNRYIKENLWAIVVADSCKADSACYQSAQRLYKGYKAKHGDIPVLYLNRHNLKNPFSVSSLASDTASAASEEEHRATANTFTRVGNNMSSVFV